MAPRSGQELIRPYGDRQDDGAVQLSFTLPMPKGPRAKEAAEQYVKKLGFDEVLVVNMEDIGTYFTWFVVFGRSQVTVDLAQIEVAEIEAEPLTFAELDAAMKERFDRKIVAVGACIGADAHTVGIDAIMNMKGYDQDYGLERYSMLEAYNLGAQIEPEDFLEKVRELKADVALVSAIVTQRDYHKDNGARFIELMKESGLRDQVICLFGGPRVDHKLALELGFDAGFGSGTLPSEVVAFLLAELTKRKEEGRFS